MIPLIFMAKVKRDNPEKTFGDALVGAWQTVTGGWSYRIPDARHKRRNVTYSHPRPADYLVTCARFTAFVETKWIRMAKTVTPWNSLTKSQRDTIESTRGLDMRYYVVLGHYLGAFVFDGHNRLCMNARHTIADLVPVRWYPFNSSNFPSGSNDMLE